MKSTHISLPTALSSVPSKPVIIPKRRDPKALRQDQGHSAVTQCSSSSMQPIGYRHDPEALPPALGALLAVTSIPPPSKRSGLERHRRSRRGNLKEVPDGPQAGELSPDDSELAARLVSSSLEILLGAPEELAEALPAPGSDLRSTLGATVRSRSSCSIPSLENDGGSTASSSMPPTPGPGSRKIGVEKRQRALSSPQAQECAFDHPLLSPPSEPDTLWNGESTDRTDVRKLRVTASPVPPKSLFKSNLTASLRALKSAARSFSSVTSPVAQHDGDLTRSLLAIQPHHTDDRRPLPSGEPPDPVLRRYLNPIGASPAELHMHSCDFSGRRTERPCTFSVELQTYRRSTLASDKATSPPVFLSRHVDVRDAGHEATQASTPPEIRQREPRENGDFLRIIVMEMNMRRNGKLADNAKGKARLWLPPRAPCQQQSRLDGDVPKRWISQVPGH